MGDTDKKKEHKSTKKEQEEVSSKKDELLETLIAFAITAIIVLLVVGLFNGWFAFLVPDENDASVDEAVRYPVSLGDDPRVGSPGAPITVIEFSDFNCPFCARFALKTKPVLMEYVNNGTVQFVYRDLPLTRIHPKALQTAKAAGCAAEQGDDAFWRYHDLLYANQDRLEIGHLEEYARTAGLNVSEFRSCFYDDRRASEINQDVQEAIDLGVTATPTFFFNGRKHVGALTPDELRTIIAEELEYLKLPKE